MLAYVPLHYYWSFSHRIRFAHGFSILRPFFGRVANNQHNLQIQAVDHSRAPNRTHRPPLHSANERGSVETICTSIGCDTTILASRITHESVTPTVIPEEDLEEDSDPGGSITDDNEDPPSEEEREHNDNTPEPDMSAHNNQEPTAQPKINTEEIVERQQRIIDFHFQHNIELFG